MGMRIVKSFFSIKNHANDVTCNKLMCMICQIPTNTLFHLQGDKMSYAKKLQNSCVL